MPKLPNIMIIFLYGKDTYRIREKTREIISRYGEKHKSGVNLRRFDCLRDNFSMKEIAVQSSQKSIFEEKKLYLLSGVFSKKDEFLEEIDSFVSSENIFLLSEEEVDEKEKTFKILKEKSSLQKFDFLSGANLKKWIKKEFEKYGKTIDEKALFLFASSVKGDLWKASNEIIKISCFSEKKEITEEDIKKLTCFDIKSEIFKTIDAIAEKKKKEAIGHIRSHIEKGENPLYLLTMIIYQFRNILTVKDLLERGEDYSSILKKTKMHPFVFRKTYSQSLKFTLPELKEIYKYLTKADLDIKTGKNQKELSLELLIAAL